MLFQTFYDCRIQMESRNKFMNDIEMYSQNQLIVKEKLGKGEYLRKVPFSRFFYVTCVF